MKCFVLSNCTHAPLREYLYGTGIFETVDSSAIYSLSKLERDNIHDRLSKYDFIVSLVHDESWGSLSYSSLKREFGDKCVLFTTPFFNGLHPDMVHISLDGEARFPSILGPYHSGFVLWGHASRIPVTEMTQMYANGELPDIFNLSRAWENGIDALKERDKRSDIETSDIYDAASRISPAMLTFNHPSMAIISKLCDRIIGRLDICQDYKAIGSESSYNSLLRDVIFPVSPAVAVSEKLKYRFSPMFKFGLLGVRPGEYLDFGQFVIESYAYYSMYDISSAFVTTPKSVAPGLQKILTSAGSSWKKFKANVAIHGKFDRREGEMKKPPYGKSTETQLDGSIVELARALFITTNKTGMSKDDISSLWQSEKLSLRRRAQNIKSQLNRDGYDIVKIDDSEK